MIFFSMVFAALYIPFVHSTNSICSNSDSLVQDLVVITDPINPIIGDSYNLTLSYTTPVDITDGSKQAIKASFDGFPISNDVLSLCDELSKNDFVCPIQSGYQSMSWIDNIPLDMPSGTLKMKQTWSLQDGRQLFCFIITFAL